MGRNPLPLLLTVLLSTWGMPLMVFAESQKPIDYRDYSGPDDVVIQSTVDVEEIAKPAYLPHKEHQWLDCDGCHHSIDNDGKKVDSIGGKKIQKCESCHNSKMNLPVKVATLKRASHRLCMECHLKQNKELARCSVCHTKK